MRARFGWPLLAVLISLFPIGTDLYAAPPATEVDTSNVIEQFEIPNNGRELFSFVPGFLRPGLEWLNPFGDRAGLLLPVKLNGEELLFMLDTGAALNVFDRSLELGESQESATIEAADGSEIELPMFASPRALLGALSWLLATCPEEKLRDGMKPWEYAKQATELTEQKDPDALEAWLPPSRSVATTRKPCTGNRRFWISPSTSKNKVNASVSACDFIKPASRTGNHESVLSSPRRVRPARQRLDHRLHKEVIPPRRRFADA
jgi:hypothetical protein